MQFTHYQILGVSQAASQQEIRKAYKRLALQYHPDRNQGSKIAEAHFIKVNQANFILSDPQRRARYDMSLRRPQRPQQARPTAQNYPPPRPRPRPQYYRPRQPQKSTWEELKDFWAHSKYGKRVLLGIFLFYIGMLGLYHFMNHYTSRAHFESGLKQEQQGNMLRAYGHYSNAIHFDENFAEAFFKRAIISMGWMRNYESAYQDIDKAITANKEKTPAEWYHLRALTAIETGRYSRAIDDLEQAIEMDGKQYQYTEPLAHTYAYFTDEPQKALNLYKMMDSDSLPKIDMAFSHIQLSQFDEAIDLLNLQLVDNPKDAPPYYYRGQAKLSVGDTVAACMDWQTALDLGLKEAEGPITNFCR